MKEINLDDAPRYLMRVTPYQSGMGRAITMIPVGAAAFGLGAPVIDQNIDFTHHPGPDLGHHFNAGTATQFARPPGGWPHQQPIPPADRYVMGTLTVASYAQPTAPERWASYPASARVPPERFTIIL